MLGVLELGLPSGQHGSRFQSFLLVRPVLQALKLSLDLAKFSLEHRDLMPLRGVVELDEQLARIDPLSFLDDHLRDSTGELQPQVELPADAFYDAGRMNRA